MVAQYIKGCICTAARARELFVACMASYAGAACASISMAVHGSVSMLRCLDGNDFAALVILGPCRLSY